MRDLSSLLSWLVTNIVHCRCLIDQDFAHFVGLLSEIELIRAIDKERQAPTVSLHISFQIYMYIYIFFFKLNARSSDLPDMQII